MKMVDFSKEFNPNPKKYSNPKLPKEVKKVSDKNKDEKTGFKKPTGELALFKEIYKEKKGIPLGSKKQVDFHPSLFLHVLSKGAYPKFRLYKKNIVFAIFDIHDLYDNSSREYLLSKYPEAKIIYELKEELKTEYYKPKPTI